MIVLVMYGNVDGKPGISGERRIFNKGVGGDGSRIIDSRSILKGVDRSLLSIF